MVGDVLSHYRLLEKIGAGGMGEVYRAHDERLDRDVAIKVLLPDALSDDAARRRFRKEALALSKLNHPNIATIFDFDTQDGVDFLVMEYVDGETLTEKLADGPLPETEMSRLGVQLAEGLAAAHRQHIVHRDLKPGNLRVTQDGLLKILDFGLAKHVLPASDLSATKSMTEAQAIVGTLPYMSPEQLRGGTVDERSDLWAAGTVLYEMATGKRAFSDNEAPRLVSQILEKPPPIACSINPNVSPALASIISRCLERDPEQRYATAKELLADLERSRVAPSVELTRPLRRSRRRAGNLSVFLVTATVAAVGALTLVGIRPAWLFGPSGYRSLAVLPFTNLTGDPSQDYFVEGMMDGLIASLAQVGGFERVTGRHSVMKFKETDEPLSEIARALNVDAVVQASLMREAGRIRVTAQLLDARNEQLLWANTFEQEMENVLRVLSDMTRDIADEVQVALSPEDNQRLAQVQRVDPEAFDAYLHGCRSLNEWTESSVSEALDFFGQSIEKDPGFAPAHAGIARAYLYLGTIGLQAIPPEEALTKAREAVLEALSIDPLLPEAHHALATIASDYDGDIQMGEREFARAIELSPNNAQFHQDFAVFLTVHLVRHEEALEEARRAVELDPLDPFVATGPVWQLQHGGHYEEALREGRKLLEEFPDFFVAHWALGMALLNKGDTESAIPQIETAYSLSEGNSNVFATLGLANARAGNVQEARRILDDLKDPNNRRYRPAFWIAAIHSSLGEQDSALAWLYPNEIPLPVFFERKLFENLSSHPRYVELKQQVLERRR